MTVQREKLGLYLKAVAFVRNRLREDKVEADEEFSFIADDLFDDLYDTENFDKDTFRKVIIDLLGIQSSYTSMILEYLRKLDPSFDPHAFLDMTILEVSSIAS